MSQREIIDAHHHLGPASRAGREDYLLEQLRADTASTTDIAATIFMECGVGYRTEGPRHLKSVGEIEFVASVADASDATEGPPIVGIGNPVDPNCLAAGVDSGRLHNRGTGGAFCRQPACLTF